MTITAKINPGLVGGDRTASIDRYAARLFDNPGMSVMSEKDPQVRLRIESLEIAPPGGPEGTLREVERALYLSRTAAGTLGSDDDVKLAEQTLDTAAAVLSGQETARLRVVLDWVIDQVRGIVDNDKHRDTDRRRLVREALTRAEAARDSGLQLDLDAAR